MRDFFVGIGFLVWGLCRLIIIRPLAFTYRTAFRAVQRRQTEKRHRAPSIAVNAPDQVQIAESGPATIIQMSGYEIADRIASIRLEPPVGVINFRVYNALGIVKRDLIINEPQLKSLMRGRRHTFPDAAYDPVQGLDFIKDETVALAEALINTVGNQSVRAAKIVPMNRSKAGPAATQVSTAPVTAAQPVASPPPAAAAGSERRDVPTTVFAPKPAAGITYVGKLISARTERMTPPGRAPYETFQAMLLLDNGVEMPLRGAELERELTSAACQVGQRVAITPVGKVPVALATGGEGSKNLYRVQNMSDKGRS